jgi:hypothetical protein
LNIEPQINEVKKARRLAQKARRNYIIVISVLISVVSEHSDSRKIAPLQYSRFPSASLGQALLDIGYSSFFDF